MLSAWEMDQSSLLAAGFQVDVRRLHRTFVEAVVQDASGSATVQWALDSAFRFFPLVAHPDLGLTLHPFDLATNKVLALVGRAEPRDWVDVLDCDEKLQPLGYLVWAASGKDPGLSPGFILEQATRSARYTEEEMARVEFAGERPTARDLARRWRTALDRAVATVAVLPEDYVGCCVLDACGSLLRADPDQLKVLLAEGGVRYHAPRLYGAWPALTEA